MKYVIAPIILAIIAIWSTVFCGIVFVIAFFWELKFPTYIGGPWDNHVLKSYHINISPFTDAPEPGKSHRYRSYYHYLFGVGPYIIERNDHYSD
jgi:hypothetical protein